MSVSVGVVAQRSNTCAAELAAEICRETDAHVLIDEEAAASLDLSNDVGVHVSEMADYDLVVSIGGDGTFLYAARGSGGAPVMGVNLGEVGFLNAVSPGDAVSAVREEVRHVRQQGQPRFRELPKVDAVGDGWALPAALNEVAVMGPQRGRNHGIGIEVRVDGSLYGGTHADGVLVCTPAGSTAYNLSEGGPLVHPAVDAFTVTEMVADDPMPPLVVGLDSEVTVRVEEAESAVVVADGRTVEEVEPPTQVTLRRAPDPVRVAGPPLDFFAALGKLD
jgi:NAD+ kinase